MQKREQIVLLLFTLFNIVSNKFIPFYSDETYYWLWSKKLALSYFDHPPMVAYLIRATTLFSDSMIEIRLAAPLAMAGSAYFLYKLTLQIFDHKSAIYAFYIFLSSIIVQAGYTLITPDIPLIFFWTLTLYVAYLYIESGDKKYALLTGIFAGALLLSKYTGVLLLLSLLLYIILYKRTLFKERYLYIALLLCTLLFLPVIYWNHIHDYISFQFQLAHGIAKEKILHLHDFMKFAGAQLVLFHPLYLIPLLYFIVRDREILSAKKFYLLLTFLFPLLFFLYFAAFKHANAQWAAPAYISAAILLAHYLAQRDAKRLVMVATAMTLTLILLLKTPLGDNFTIIKNFKARVGKIENFRKEIEALNLDIDSYNYILLDDYHDTDIAYYFGKTDNLLVLSVARFSNFNIWRNEDLNISISSPLKHIPKLGKCLYIGISDMHIHQLNQLFDAPHYKAIIQKKIGSKKLIYYFVEYTN